MLIFKTKRAIGEFRSGLVTTCEERARAVHGGARPYHFRSGPISGPTTRPGSHKSKIFVVHSLAVLKVFKMQETPMAAQAPPRTPLGSAPDPAGEAYSAPLAGGKEAGSPKKAGCPLHKNPTPALGPSGLQPWLFGSRSLPPQIRYYNS